MRILITNANIVNEGKRFTADVLIKDQLIEKIDKTISTEKVNRVIDANGMLLIPGVIDDQVHFREPGLTHKANIYTESRAAVAGGVTSYMEMPNTNPPALTQKLLEDKYQIAAKTSLANYSFFMGASNDNYEEVMRTNPKNVCGLKIFLGSSTGNLLVDDEHALEHLFQNVKMLIATHCEDESTILANTQQYINKYGDNIPIKFHPLIRSEEGCYKSSSHAVELAKQYDTRLHILHISTAKELQLFSNALPLNKKKITAEACIHHLWFTENDYDRLGTLIKWNPAIKKASDRDAILNAVIDDTIDVIATDHAPHTLEEKMNVYTKAPSGGPLIQHGLVAMLELHRNGKITLEKIVEKMCHNPAVLFSINKRGFIREGYYADLVLVDPGKSWTVTKENMLAKCQWSPFEGQKFQHTVMFTIVNGVVAFENGQINETNRGLRLSFERL
jgi:dihydroorotase